MKNLRQLLRRSGLFASGKRRTNGRSTKSVSARRLNTETLEKRELLAGDIALAHNYIRPADVTDDALVSPNDALQIINFLSRNGSSVEVTERGQVDRFYDVNKDNQITPSDALAVVNAISTAESEFTGKPIELDINPRDINDDAIAPTTAGGFEYNVNVGDIFYLEVSYEDFRGFGATGVFELLTDVSVMKDGAASPVLEPVITETQRITFDESIQQANPTDTFSFSFENSTATSTPVSVSEFGRNPTGTITSALVELGYTADQVNVTRLTSGAPDFRYQIRFVDFALEGQDLPDLQVIQSATSPIDIDYVDIPGIVPDGNGGFQPNYAAVASNLDLRSRTFNDNEEFLNVLTFGSFDPTTGFDGVGGSGPLVAGGVPAEDDDGQLEIPFDAYSIPVRITQPVEDLEIQLTPERVTVYGTSGENDLPLTDVGSTNAFFVLNAIGTATGVTADNATRGTTEDAQTATTVDLSSLVTVNSGGAATISIVTDASRGATSFDGTTLQYTPSADEFGSDQVVYEAVNGDGTDRGTIFINIAAVNDLPVANADSDSTQNDATVTIDVLSNDTSGALNEADTLTVVSATDGNRGTTSVNANGTIDYTPTGSIGSDTFTYTLSDGTDTVQGTVSVNVTPAKDVLAADGNLSTSEDNPNAVTIDLSTLVTITNGGDPTFSIVTQNPRGTVSLTNGSTLSYIPAADDFVTEVIEYRAANTADNDTGFITVSITSVNDPPTAGNDSDTTAEDTAVTISVLANDSTGPANENQNLTITGVSNEINGTAAITDNGTSITFTPAANVNGTGSFTYTVSDGVDTTNANVTVTITAVNDSPVAQNDQASGNEDTTLQIDVKANDSDVDGDSTSVIAVRNGANGVVVNNNDGTVSYTPEANFFGTDSFEYDLSDGTETVTATVAVTVLNVNDKPVAVADSAGTNEDTSVLIDVLNNDSAGPNETENISIASVGQAINGSAVVENGQVRFTPGQDFVGTASFVYSVNDGNLNSDPVSVTITVAEQNDPPEAVGDTATVAEDDSVDIDVVANDTDDLTPTANLSVTAVTQGSNGSVAINNDGTVKYTPSLNFNGSDSFTYTVSDGVLSSNATVVVTVTPVNDEPTAVTDVLTTSGDDPVVVNVLANDSDLDGDTVSLVSATNGANGTTLVNANGTITYTPNAGFSGTDSFNYTITDGNLTAQGTVNITDQLTAPTAGDASRTVIEDAVTSTIIDLSTIIDADQGETPSIQITVNGQRGVAVLNGSDLRYTPTADEFGSDTVVYQVANSVGSDTGTISISITPVNDDPVAGNDTASVIKNQSVTVSVLDNDSTGAANENDTMTVSNASTPANGSVVVNADNTITYTPNSDFVGTDSFTYDVSDGTTSDTATVSITVQDFEASEISGELFIDLIENINEYIQSPSTVTPIRNGVKDAGESGLAGVEIRLFSAASDNVTGAAVDRVVLTDFDGQYAFSNVAPGTYEVIYDIPDTVHFGANADGSQSDGTMQIQIGAAGGVTASGTSFTLLGLNSSAMGNIDVLSSNYHRNRSSSGGTSSQNGGMASLDANGNQEFFMVGSGFDSAVFGEIALNNDRDAALLTVIKEDGSVKTARLSSDDFVVSSDGTAVRFFGAYDDFNFVDSGSELVANEFTTYRDAVDAALANMS